MASQPLRIRRIEGGMELERTDEGAIRIRGGAPRIFERMLLRKHPQDAVYLTQQISADSGISHALAFLNAWESAGKVSLPRNAEILREILHLLSMLHAHLRQFYAHRLLASGHMVPKQVRLLRGQGHGEKGVRPM